MVPMDLDPHRDLITAGQAKRLLRTYGFATLTVEPVSLRNGDSATVEESVTNVATYCRDPQGAYADARALRKWLDANQAFDLTHEREDTTVVPWGYR
jgi:hypothetical protein